MRNLSVALSAFAWLASGQQSQQQSPSPLETAQKNQGQTKPEQPQKGTEINTVPTYTNPAEQAALKQDKPTAYSQQPAPADWWTIGNAALLTFFTGALAWSAHNQWRAMNEQAVYMRQGLDENKRMAEAPSATKRR
jgi:hypothetical protein